jgi:hypothetical protein
MTPWARRTYAAASLLGFVVVGVASLNVSPEERQPSDIPRIDPPPVPAIVQSLKPLEAYSAISQRPLFSPSRQPAPPPQPKQPVQQPAAAPPAAPEAVLPQVVLLAVAIAPDRREAVLRLPTGKSTTLYEGAKLEDWLLKKILPDRIVFSLADKEQEVTFPVAQPAPAASRLPPTVPRH